MTDSAATSAVSAIRAQGVPVDDSTMARSAYSSDASIYRVEPAAIAFPRSVEEAEAVLAVARDHRVPVTARGAGTSIAGNAIGRGLVVDFRRNLDALVSLDPVAGSARVEPGIVHATLQRSAAPHGLRFGPDPSSHSRATIGGMIGNNACGSRALGYGRTSDNVLGLHVLTAAGEHLKLGSMADRTVRTSTTVERLRGLVGENLAVVRTEFGRFGRQVSGYSLEHLLPENGFDLSRMLVGSEGTLGLVVGADVRLISEPTHRLLVVLGYPDMVQAAAAVPAILPLAPVACEGLDRRITDAVRTAGRAVPDLPRGGGWLFVEVAGEDLAHLEHQVRHLAAASDALDHRVVRTAGEAAALWRIREDGSGLVARTQDGSQAHAGWEDSAVPPSSLAAYLSEFELLLEEHGLTGVPYGHFGDGCLHVRIDFRLEASDGRRRYREFLLDAARLVGMHGGSMSGEHGDGRARSELLSFMYSPQVLGLFSDVKRLFDPENLLNPGVIVAPVATDEDVRYVPAVKHPGLAFLYEHDADEIFGAAHRCTGIGRCVAPHTSQGSVICPSFRATGQEQDSTRGRARILQDAVSGRLGPDGLRATEVQESLDLCLACKGCRSDCPTGVDMAAYKAEVLHQTYRGRLRPRSHYSLGRLPTWLRLGRATPWLFNLAGRAPSRLVAWAAGVDARRGIPAVAPRAERSAWRAVAARDGHSSHKGNKEVVLFVDTFTDSFTPRVARAVVAVLHSAGYRITLPERATCCGLTWISTGQLDAARKKLVDTVAVLHPYARRGARILGLEPSCTAVLRADLVELVDSQAARDVASAVVTLAELLLDDDEVTLPDLRGVDILAQPHCHHHAVLGWGADRTLLERSGARVRAVGGCCGLAGNFGAEKGHYDVSIAVAESELLPALRSAHSSTVVLADGFSCRTQIQQLADLEALHLAELLTRE